MLPLSAIYVKILPVWGQGSASSNYQENKLSKPNYITSLPQKSFFRLYNIVISCKIFFWVKNWKEFILNNRLVFVVLQKNRSLRNEMFLFRELVFFWPWLRSPLLSCDLLEPALCNHSCPDTETKQEKFHRPLEFVQEASQLRKSPSSITKSSNPPGCFMLTFRPRLNLNTFKPILSPPHQTTLPVNTRRCISRALLL